MNFRAAKLLSKMTVFALLLILIISSIPLVIAFPKDLDLGEEITSEVIQPDTPSLINNEEKIITDGAWSNIGNKNSVWDNKIISTLNSLYIRLKAAEFDPKIEEPELPADLMYKHENEYFIVQCNGPIQPQWIKQIRTSCAIILGYIPDYAYIVKMDDDEKRMIRELPFIRWIGIFHPAYKLQNGLIEKSGEVELNIMVFKDSEDNLKKVSSRLSELDGIITYDGKENNIVRTKIDSSKIKEIAFIPEVEWIDFYTPPISFMDNVRIFTGANNLHLNGFNGQGIVGEVKDNGFDENHPDFAGQIIGTDGNPPDGAHGTCTFGIVFSSGQNDEDALGMLPGGEGAFCYWGVERNTSINNLVNNWNGVFQSNSWSQGWLDSTYTSISQENDDAVFYSDVTMLYAAGNSNDGVESESLTQDSVSKNVICVGAVSHFDDADKSNDQWVNWGAGMTPSQGPAADGRIKPDLAGVFDAIYTTDSVDGDGNDGYATGNYYDDMGGTSGATPIVAGGAGLVYQMYRENFFGNNPSGSLPHAATVKAILIADAYQYDFSQADRYQQGWGLVDLNYVYDIGENHFIVDEELNLQTGGSVSYIVTPTTNTPLKISLVWTDVPGVTSSSLHLVNNLDLKVTAPNGDTYYGNVGLINSKWSSIGGSYDSLNNVENVFIENPMSGDWKIEIIAQNIALDGNPDTPAIDQNFALVASGVLQAEYDIGVTEIQVPKYLVPNEPTSVEGNICNNGLFDEFDLVVNFTVEGETQDTQIIPQLESGETTEVIFNWVPPKGIYTVGIEVQEIPNEDNIANNVKETEVIVEPDVSVTDLEAAKYLRPNEDTMINATVHNLGKVDIYNMWVQLLVNGSLENSVKISSLPAETDEFVSFEWVSEEEGWLEIEVYAIPVYDEEIISNNKDSDFILVTSKELINVCVVDSWGTDFYEDAPWDFINENWIYLGLTPIKIDYTTLNKNGITYEDLEDSDADVLVISNAFAWEFSDSEIEAISNYVQGGHGLIATSATFYQNVQNNNKLAFLFGMRDDISYDADTTDSLELLEPDHPLFRNLQDPYRPATELSVTPPDYSWDADDLTGGTYLAKSEDNIGAIIVNNGVVYISHWIGYESNIDDIQLYYNAMIWSKHERQLRDIAVVDIEVSSYLPPNWETTVNATVTNLGLSNELDLTVYFNVNGALESSTSIPSLTSGSSTKVNFMWTTPSIEGTHLLEVEIPFLPNENVTTNNIISTNVIVTNGPNPGRIALISDGNQLQAIISILNNLGKEHDSYNNNVVTHFTGNTSLLLQYEMVIFYNDNRVINDLEHKALNDYTALGGSLIVTGYDSLGNPVDTLLADVIRSSEYGDNMGKNLFTVRDGLHPIMNGIYGQYPTDSVIMLGETNHDRAEADFSRGAYTLAELSDGYDKIIATELSLGGKIIYWNGNTNCNDWIQEDLVPMFKNMIVWVMPIYNDIGVLSLSNPLESFIGESVSVQGIVKNFGKNDHNDLEVLLNIKNSYGFTIYSDSKTGLSLNSGDSKELVWQWTPSLCGYYSLEIKNSLLNDEVSANDQISGQITIYIRFFSDDMESGIGEWEASTSSPGRDPLWHLTTSESNSPITSWWCGDDSSNQYTVLAEQYLYSPLVDLRDAHFAFLSFYHKYNIDDFPFMQDWGYLEINFGGEWVELESFSGALWDWDRVSHDLSSYIGSIVQIRFHLSSGVVLTDNGWWVDDVEIYGIGNQYDIELWTSTETEDLDKNGSAIFDVFVRNSGNVNGTADLSLYGSNMDGWITVFSQDEIDLLPGETVNVTLTILPSLAEYGEYSATVVGELKAGGTVRAFDDIPITITINQWYDVRLETLNNELSLIPDETKHYNISVINEGNGYDNILLSTEFLISGVSTDWQFSLSKTLLGLNAFQSEAITLSVTAPSNAFPGDKIVINLIGKSSNEMSEIDILQTTTIVIEYHFIELNTSHPIKETEPGLLIEYSVVVRNNGNTEANINLDIVSVSGSWDGWSAVLSTKYLSLGAFSFENVMLSITPPDNAIAYNFKEFNITAATVDSSSFLPIKTDVALSGEIEVMAEVTDYEAANGETARYPFILINTQNHEDTIDITASSKNGWDIVIFNSGGNTILADNDGDGKPDTGLISPTVGTIEIIIGIKVPENAIAYTKDEATIKFYSSLPTGNIESILLTTEAKLSGNVILSSESHSKSDFPGKKISYLVSVENQINYQAVIDISISSSNKWEVELFDETGFIPLEDTNRNGKPDTGLLDELEGSREIIVVLTLPENAIAYTTDKITITGIPSITGINSHSMELTAEVGIIHDLEIVQKDEELSVERGEELVYTIEILNKGNYLEVVDLRFDELPNGWRASFSSDEPDIHIDSSRVISVDMEIPSDTEPGEYTVVIKATSEDGTPAGEFTSTIEVTEPEDQFEFLYLWLFLILLILCIIIIAILVARRRRREVPSDYLSYTTPGGYGEMIFPTIQMISCPNCYETFEVAVGKRPHPVQCPRCGTSGLIR